MPIGSHLRLKPISWHQSVEHFTSINVEGRRFTAHCEVQGSTDLRLSNGMKLWELPVEIQIFESSRMREAMAKLPQDALGSFSFHDAMPGGIDYDDIDPFLSGWFVLNAQLLEDAWQQVMHGGYADCSLMVEIGPVENDTGPGFLWDVKKHPHLQIDTVTLSFTRKAPSGPAALEP